MKYWHVLTSTLLALSASPSMAEEIDKAAAPVVAPEATPESLRLAEGRAERSALGLRFDCLHDFNLDEGSSQSCISLSGLRYTYRQTLSPRIQGMVRLDPFGSTSTSRSQTPLRQGLPMVRDTAFTLVDDYALIWTPRPNLEISIEEYGGSAKIPAVSGLSLGSPFADTGWDQTALTVTYNLSTFTDMKVKFAAGNGEGENGQNLDPQQYFGFELTATMIPGVLAGLGASLDGNNVGSGFYDWETKRYQTSCGIAAPTVRPKTGYSTQRLGIGVALDGTLPQARGLELGIGWQRNVFSDLNKDRDSGPSVADLKACPTLDVDTVFVEDQEGDAVNTVQRTTFTVSFAYRILDTYFVGADYSSRRIDTGSVDLFTICGGYREAVCVATGKSVNALSQSAVTFGGGMDLADGLKLTLEYQKRSYDQKYAQVYYPAPNGKTSESLELFNARLAYNWQ